MVKFSLKKKSFNQLPGKKPTLPRRRRRQKKSFSGKKENA